MKDKLIEDIKKAFDKLRSTDGCLFKCPIEENYNHNARKLHEICINHKLANYLEEFVCPLLQRKSKKFFVDIEFNREGKRKKRNDNYKLVRPDIIIHNRKSDCDKYNVLVVECKKHDRNTKNSIENEDVEKIKAFMTEKKYGYEFGLYVEYGDKEIRGLLFYHGKNGNIESEQINCVVP